MIPPNFSNSLSTSEILSNLSKLNLSEYPVTKIHDLIRQLGKYTCVVTNIFPGTPIFRARLNCNFEEFSKKKDLSYKPAEYNKIYQRASTPSRTMFYGSLTSDGSGLERNDYNRLLITREICRLLRDESISDGEQKITYSKWIPTKPIPIVPIIYNFENILKGQFTTQLQNDIAKFQSMFPNDLAQKGNLISKFLEDQFSKEETRNDYDYLLSAIYTERLTHNPDPKLAGVLYPSVRTKELKGKGYNVAISPEFVDNNMELEVVAECTIYKKGNKVVVDNDKEAILLKGQEDFELIPITDPKVHAGRERVYKILNDELKVNVINSTPSS